MIGIDEVGRGSLVGEVFACACFFESSKINIENLKDSKLLSSKKRNEIFKFLSENENIKYAIGTASLEEIQQLNILHATMLAMERALISLKIEGVPIFIDGNTKPKNIPIATCVIGGDKTIPQISAASILAKVIRDAEMQKLSLIIPQYEIQKNKGYGTKKHFEAIKEHGLSDFHRKGWNI